jgi:hypothetical protein
MKKSYSILLLCVTILLLSYNFFQRDNTRSINAVKDTCFICQNNEGAFKDTTWFLPYLDVLTRDTMRQVLEKWISVVNDDCLTYFKLYTDSTYIYHSCEVDGWETGGFYHYCNDTLFCVEITPNSEFDAEHNPPSIKGIEKYVRNKNKL